MLLVDGQLSLNKIIQKSDSLYEIETLSKDKVIIGDKEEFKPVVQLNRWNDESYLKVSFDDNNIISKQTIFDQVNDKLKWITPSTEIHYYYLEPTIYKNFTQFEYGGIELEFIIKSKPLVNFIKFNIEYNNLVFYYQPELTQKEIDEGSNQPDNVVNSYAVYHNSKSNNEYKTGKAFHIYRPYIIDSIGNFIWGKLYIDDINNELYIMINQTYLNNAIYPISIDPSFGYTSIGGNNNDNDDKILGSWALASTGTADNISMYYEFTKSGNNIKAALYDYDGAGDAGNLFDNTTEVTGLGIVSGWQTTSFPSPPSISAQNYFIIGWAEATAGGGKATVKYDNSGAGKSVDKTLTYGAWPNPLTGETSRAWIFSIYCNYTVSVSSINRTLTESLIFDDSVSRIGIVDLSVNENFILSSNVIYDLQEILNRFLTETLIFNSISERSTIINLNLDESLIFSSSIFREIISNRINRTLTEVLIFQDQINRISERSISLTEILIFSDNIIYSIPNVLNRFITEVIGFQSDISNLVYVPYGEADIVIVSGLSIMLFPFFILILFFMRKKRGNSNV